MSFFRPGKKPRKAFVPRLEALESRWCPSASINIAAGVLTVTGDGNTDNIAVTDNGHGGIHATVYAANDTTVLASGSGSGLSEIKINGAGGNDTIDYTLSNALSKNEKLVLNLGGGSVNADLNYNAGISSNLSVLIDGAGSGNDTVETDFGALSSSARVSLDEYLGAGTSTGTVNYNDAIAAGAWTGVTIHGESGTNHAAINFDGAVSGKVHVVEHLGTGTTTAGLTFSGGIDTGASVFVQVDGGTSANQANVSFGNATGAHLRIDEGLGSGTTGSQITFGNLSGDVVHVNLDAGHGSHQVSTSYGTISGGTKLYESDWLGAASDQFTTTLNGDIQGHSHADFEIYTNKGNDTATVNALTTDITAGSSLGIHLHALAGTKTLTVNYTGNVNGYLDVSAPSGTGNATIAENIDVLSGNGTVHAREWGGPGTDSLTLDVTGDTSDLSSLYAVIHANPANTVVNTSNVHVKT
jgi:hypothetical protein